MKKFSIVLALIMSAFVLFGCSSGATYTWESNKPWGKNTSAYEKCVYEVEIYSRIKDGNTYVNKDLLALGTYTLILEQSMQNTMAVVTLSSSLVINYADEEYANENRNLTDTVTSKVIFSEASLTPIYSERTYNEAVRKNGNEYKENNSYTYTADYTAGNATISKDKNVSANGVLSNNYIQENTAFSLKSGARVFDNEQLYYVARASGQVAPNSNTTYDISNIYDISNTITSKGKYKFTPIAASTGEALTDIDLTDVLSDFTMNSTDEQGNKIQIPVENVACMKTIIAINETKSGPNTSITMTTPSTTFLSKRNSTQTTKIITGISYTRYNLDTSEESETYTYKLSSYTTSKNS